jgi:hypothetical protein
MNLCVIWRRTLLAATAAILAGSPGAWAGEPLVHFWKAEIDGWLFAPAHTPQGDSVLGFLAWAEPDVVVGDNVSILWYERQADGRWRVMGWKSDDFISAVAHARTLMGNQSLWAGDPEIDARLAVSGAPQEPVPTEMDFGLFVDDPNAPAFLNAEDPALAIEEAAEDGYPAAPLLSSIATNDATEPPPSPCISGPDVNTTIILNRLTLEAETAMWGVSTIVAGELDEICCWCPCTTSISYGPWILTGTTMVGNTKVCHYLATQSTTRRCFGHYLTSCGACNTSRVIATTTVYVNVPVLPQEQCPHFGGTGTPTGDPPGPYH